MKKVRALVAITTPCAAVAAPVAKHAGKAAHKGAHAAVEKAQGKAAKGKSVAKDAPQTMETAPAAVAPAPQQAAPAVEIAPQAPAAHYSLYKKQPRQCALAVFVDGGTRFQAAPSRCHNVFLAKTSLLSVNLTVAKRNAHASLFIASAEGCAL